MRIDRLRVDVDGPVDATALASAIRRRLAGDTWPAGPERHVADAVRAVRDGVGTPGHDDVETRWH